MWEIGEMRGWREPLGWGHSVASEPLTAEVEMKLRTPIRAAAVACALTVSVPGFAQNAELAPGSSGSDVSESADLNLRAVRQMGRAPVVSGATRVWSARTGAELPSFLTSGGDVVMSLSSGIGVLPTTCRPSGRLQFLPPGTVTVINRGSARADAAAIEQIANAGEVVVGSTGFAGERLFDGVAVPVTVSGVEEDVVWTPFETVAVLADRTRTVVDAELAVVRNSDGSGRVIMRYASGGPLTIVATIDVTYQNAGQRLAEGASGTGTIEVTPRSARLRFNLAPEDADAALDALQQLGEGEAATISFASADGEPEHLAAGEPTVRDRSMRVALRDVRRDPTQARAVIVVSDPEQIPSDIVVSVSDPYRDDGFTSTSTEVQALFGVVMGMNTSKENPDEALDALLEQGDEGMLLGSYTYGRNPGPLAEDTCMLEPVSGASCETPSGATIRLRTGPGRIATSVQFPYYLEAPAVRTVQVTTMSGDEFAAGAPESTRYRGVVTLSDMPVVEIDDIERRVQIEFFDEDGLLTGITGTSFLPAAGMYPLLPEPLGPIRFDPGCAWWDLPCEWGW